MNTPSELVYKVIGYEKKATKASTHWSEDGKLKTFGLFRNGNLIKISPDEMISKICCYSTICKNCMFCKNNVKCLIFCKYQEKCENNGNLILIKNNIVRLLCLKIC